MNIPPFNSFSSSLMFSTTLFRNQPGILNKLIAQVAYPAIALIATLETGVSGISVPLTFVAHLITGYPISGSVKWASSSLFTIGWSITDFVFNLFAYRLVADEASARQILESGNLMMIPPGAFI